MKQERAQRYERQMKVKEKQQKDETGELEEQQEDETGELEDLVVESNIPMGSSKPK